MTTAPAPSTPSTAPSTTPMDASACKPRSGWRRLTELPFALRAAVLFALGAARRLTGLPFALRAALLFALGAARRLMHEPSALIGGTIVLLFVLMALCAPLVAPYDPVASDWMAIRMPPSAAHWFGTDDLGRDVLSRIIFGTRASLSAGVVSVTVAVLVGVPFGLLAGYYGRFVDMAISRIADALLACPFLVLAIALAAFLGPSLQNAMVAIGISATPIFIRVARAQTLVVCAEDYIAAARSQGIGDFAIISGHVLPNVLAPIIVQATLTMAIAVLAEASLAFLGLGQLPPAPSWGSMLDVARQFLGEAPWMAVWPGLAIIAVVVGFNLLGDGLNDALNPRE